VTRKCRTLRDGVASERLGKDREALQILVRFGI
jgi:hypothetical protein